MSDNTAKVGQVITWRFSKHKNPSELAGKIFSAKVVSVDYEQMHYNVFADYGADQIPFSSVNTCYKTGVICNCSGLCKDNQ